MRAIALPGGGALSKIPGEGDLLALTLDDGVNSEVVRAYIQLAKDTGARMTFFVNGIYNSWTDNAPMLRPPFHSGQIQLGNHTWSHPDLTTVPQSKVAQELTHNDEFPEEDLRDRRETLLSGRPMQSATPPVDAVAADLEHTVPDLMVGFALGFDADHRGRHRENGRRVLHPAGHRHRSSQSPAGHSRLPTHH